MLPHDHALVDLGLRLNERDASLLRVRQPVAERHATLGGDQRPGARAADGTQPWLVPDEARRHDAVAARGGKEGVAQADQAARGNRVLQADGATAIIDHIGEAGAPVADQVADGADVLLGGVDDELLHRLVHHAIDGLGNDLRTGDLELVPLTPHRLDQDREVQLAPAGDGEDIGLVRGLNTQGEVRLQFAVQPLVQLAGGAVLPLAAGEGRGVDAEREAQRRLLDGDHRQGLRRFGIGQGGADLGVREASERDDLARACLRDFDALQAIEDGETADLLPGLRAVGSQVQQGVSRVHRAALDLANGDASTVGVVVKRGDQHLSRAIDIDIRRWHFAHDGLEERPQVWSQLLHLRLESGAPFASDGEEHRELKLIRIGCQVQEEILQAAKGLIDARGRAVDLVDDHNRTQSALKCPRQDGAGLRHGAFNGVDKQEAPIGHVQDTLDLATEIGVAGGVDDVDLDALIVDGGVLGQDGDAALALQVIGVHDQGAGGRWIPEDV